VGPQIIKGTSILHPGPYLEKFNIGAKKKNSHGVPPHKNPAVTVANRFLQNKSFIYSFHCKRK